MIIWILLKTLAISYLFNNSNKLTPHEYEIAKLTGSRIAKFIAKVNAE